MATVIDGSEMAFKASVFGLPDWHALEFLSQQYNNISSFAKGAGEEFFKEAKDMYDKLSGSTAIRMARRAAQSITSVWDTNEIKRLTDIIEIQLAQSVMQRWIMANPVLRNKYHRQEVDGYSDSYIDNAPNDVGENHYDYRRVMNGMTIEKDDKLLCVTYPDDLLDEKELTIEEQVDILDTWSKVEYYLSQGKEDPTSKWGDHLI